MPEATDRPRRALAPSDEAVDAELPQEETLGAEESQPPPPAQQPPGTTRPARQVLRSFIVPGKGQLVVALMLALTAMLVVWTLRTQASQPDYSNLRREELVSLLDTVSSETRRLEEEVRELQTSRDRLASGAQGAQTAQEEAARRLETLKILAGVVPAHGKGIRIIINDPNDRVTPELLLNALEEMRDAGAEVIEFNDQVRVVATTWLGLDERGLPVADGTEITFPLVIEVIGDPPTLEAGLRFRGGLVSEVEGPRVGGTVAIEQLDVVDITSVVVPVDNEFARPN